MIVAGIMSGTSADGIDVALCRITAPGSSSPLSTSSNKSTIAAREAAHGARSPWLSSRSVAEGSASPRLKLLAHHHVPFTTAMRKAVLTAMSDAPTSTAHLAQLHWRLGALFADAVGATIAASGVHPQLIALHGQTVYHQATANRFLGARTRATWQLGEPSVLAERFGVPVVSDFRPADLAAGGQGAPLVPMLDYALFRHNTRNRLLLNLGGIANVTALPAASTATQVLAFDTGPANMVVDALMLQLVNKRYDRHGANAARGRVIEPVLRASLAHAFFAAAPPKSCGREQFGAAFAAHFLGECRRHSTAPADAIATATALTASSIADAYARFVWPHFGQLAPQARGTDLYTAGGGTHNRELMRQLTATFAACGIRMRTTDDAGLPSAAKEAAAFALLGWLRIYNLPGNLPSATGAAHPAVLGKLTHA